MKKKKNLIVCYSRTGTTEIIAKILREKLACDMDKIDYASAKGKVPSAVAAWEAIRRTKKEIKNDAHKPQDYDRIFFVTPTWAGGLATPIRSYMATHRDNIESYSLLITCAGTALGKVRKDARAVMKKAPEASVEFRNVDIKQGEYDLSKLFSQFKEEEPPDDE